MDTASQDITRELKPMVLSPLVDQPLFSILIANYNYGKYLGEALDSLLGQTYGNFEAVVCDDGSTDDSRDVVQSYAERDARIKLIAKENGGVASALNAAYARSTGDLLAILDADDVFMPTKLEQVLATFRSDTQAGLCVHPVTPVSATGRQIAPPTPDILDTGWVGPEALKRGGFSRFPPASGLTFRRETISPLFPLPVLVKRGLDYFLSHTAQFYARIAVVETPLALYRIHGANLTGSAGFNVAAMQKCVEDIETLLPVQREFLSHCVGPSTARALRIEDHAIYWESLLTLRVLGGRQAREFRGYTARQLVSQIRPRRRRRVWRLLTLMPTPLARPMFYLWPKLGKLRRELGVFGNGRKGKQGYSVLE